MIKIKIHITKEILEKSSVCSTDTPTNCAFALAVRDLFPEAHVYSHYICPTNLTNAMYGRTVDNSYTLGADIEEIQWPIRRLKLAFPISQEMSSFIKKFDSATPKQRRNMPEESFELKIPYWAIEETIDISEIDKILEQSSTLELVTT